LGRNHLRKMKKLIHGIGKFTSKQLENWIVENIQEYIPDKFDTKEKISDNAQEVALILEGRGIQIDSVIPVRKDDKVVRTWIIRDKRFEEIVDTMTINLKTFSQVL